MFKVVIEDKKLQDKLNGMAERAGDITKPLRKFGGHIKSQAIDIWKAQGFQGLAASTIAKRVQKGVRNVERKLKGDIRKARGRQEGIVPHRGLLSRILGSASLNVAAPESRGVKNRLAVLREFEQKHRRTGLALRGDLKSLTLKQAQSLSKREDKAVAKAVGKPILGNLAGMLQVVVQDDTVTIAERTREGWSEVHNHGDGHVPKRQTLPPPTDEDLGVLGQIIKEHCLVDFAED